MNSVEMIRVVNFYRSLGQPEIYVYKTEAILQVSGKENVPNFRHCSYKYTYMSQKSVIYRTPNGLRFGNQLPSYLYHFHIGGDIGMI